MVTNEYAQAHMRGDDTSVGYGEDRTVKEINKNHSGVAVAHRLLQPKGHPVWCDLLVDSADTDLYAAIEVKKIGTKRALNFNFDFNTAKSGHQLDRMWDYCQRCGRKGYIVLYVKNGRFHDRYVFYLPVVYQWWKAGNKSILPSNFEAWNVEDKLKLFKKKPKKKVTRRKKK